MTDMLERAEASESRRLLSLDIFRGLMVIAMMLVDWPGSWDLPRFGLFEHSPWAGITAPDFIFPSFLFIMGVAIPFALQPKLAKGLAPRQLYGRIFRRGALLLFIGYAMNVVCTLPAPLDFSVIRVPGTLQRFGIVYPLVALACLHLKPRHIAWLGISMLVTYWVVMTWVPVPGFGMPNLLQVPSGEVTPNLATWLDKVVLGHRVYAYPFDPEGILNTIPAIGSGLLGVLAGKWLMGNASRETQANSLFTWGVGLLVVGYFWGMTFPLCKNMWTSSFIVFMGGASLLFFGAIFYVVDIRGFQSRLFALPRWYGANALGGIVIFTMIDWVMGLIPVGHKPDHTAISLKEMLFNSLFRSWAADKHASWLYSVVAILALSLLFRWFHRKQIYLKV